MQWVIKASIKPEERRRLYDVIKESKPKYVLETGSGASTSVILLALKENGFGHLTSIDKPDMDGVRKRGGSSEIRQHWQDIKTHYSNWTVHDVDIKKRLPLVVNGMPQIDFFLDDSFHTDEHVFWELDLVLPKFRKGSIFAMHDLSKMPKIVKHMNSRSDFEYMGKVRALGFWRRIK